MEPWWELLANSLAVLAYLGVLLFALLIIPLGLPGLSIQVVAAAIFTAATAWLGWPWVVIFLCLALFGELIEFLSGRWGARRFGGSRQAGWGAIIGGFMGLFLGVPIPIIGPIIGTFLGTFAGAIVGEMIARRADEPDFRVGLGAVVGRALGVGTKVVIGFLILTLSIAALIAQSINV